MSLYMLAAAKYTEVADHSDIGVVVVTGLVLVFAVLILLYLLIALEGVVFSNLDKKKQQKAQGGADAAALPPKAAAPAPAPAVQVEAGIPGEVVAAIAAAVACMEDGRYSLRSVARPGKGRSAWGDAAVAAYTQPF